MLCRYWSAAAGFEPVGTRGIKGRGLCFFHRAASLRWWGCWVVKAFAEKFYGSQAWKRCRRDFAKSRHGLCELCAQEGLLVPGVIVHHKVELTPANIADPHVTLDWGNLQLLCRDCHARVHEAMYHRGGARRYKLDEMGRVVL